MTNARDAEAPPDIDGHAVTEILRLMHYRRFAALFLSDETAFAAAREGGKRWIEEEPDCCWAQHWWRLFEAGVETLASAIGADSPEGRHLRTTPPGWLMPYPLLTLDTRRAEWRAAKRWLIEKREGSLRDPFERWQELVEVTKAEIAKDDGLACAEVPVAWTIESHSDTPETGAGDGPRRPV